MSAHPPSPNLDTIRKLLQAAFTVEELPRFCQDDPLLRPILALFSPKHNLSDMVAEVITYCDTNLLFDHLLNRIRQKNPRQYARFEADLKTTEVPSLPPPPMPSKRRLQIDEIKVLGCQARGLILILTCLLIPALAIIAILWLIIPQERSTPTPLPVLPTTMIPPPTALPRKTPTPSVTATLMLTPAATARPSSTPTATATATSTATPTSTPSSTPAPTDTAMTTATATSSPTATLSPTDTPTPWIDFRIKEVVAFADGSLDSTGLHNIYFTVVDADGTPIDGIILREVNNQPNEEVTTGSKGPGRTEFTMWKGDYRFKVVGNVSDQAFRSETTHVLSVLPGHAVWDDLIRGGICADAASCEALGPIHYSYNVTFQRAW